jgi:hypothetical protein
MIATDSLAPLFFSFILLPPKDIVMRANLHLSLVTLILLIFTSVATAQEFAAQRRRDAVRSAKTFVAGLESPGDCPVEIETNQDGAVGVVIRPQTLPFYLFVPQKNLEKTDFEGKDVGTGFGVPVGYLFPGPIGDPVVDGKLVYFGRDKLQNTVVEDAIAGRLILSCFVLTASRAKDGSYRLHAFGTDKKPLFSVPLEKVEKTNTSMEVKDLDLKAVRLKLTLTLGTGWRATFPFGAPPRP